MILLKNIRSLYTGSSEEAGVDVLIEGNRISRISKDIPVPTGGSTGAGGAGGGSPSAGVPGAPGAGGVTGESGCGKSDGPPGVTRGRSGDSPPGGPAGAAAGKHSAAECEVIDCSRCVVMPGLVNTHHHFYQTLQRCLPAVQNEPLFDWLTTLYRIWMNLDEDAVHWSALVACGELLKTGCTTSTDQLYVFPRGTGGKFIDVEIEAAASIGMRFQPTRGSMSLGKSKGGLPPDEVVQTEEEILEDSERLIEKYHDRGFGAMVRIALGPCSPFSVSKDLLVKTRDLADRKGVLLHTHIAETRDEEEYCLEKYGKRPLALMADCGWLGEDVWYAHGIHFNDEEMGLLETSGTGICHCPTSNMRLGSGAARVPEMLEMGIRVGLGVDGSASNDSSDMLAELRNCFLLQRLVGGGGAITARQVLELGTRGGASLLGRDDIGTVAEGKAADIICIDTGGISHAGALHDYIASVVICGGSHRVKFCIVNGRVVVRDGELTMADEEEIVRNADLASKRLLSA